MNETLAQKGQTCELIGAMDEAIPQSSLKQLDNSFSITYLPLNCRHHESVC